MKNLLRFIKNIWLFRKELWKYRDFDYGFSLRLFNKGVEELAKGMRERSIIVNAEEYSSQIDTYLEFFKDEDGDYTDKCTKQAITYLTDHIEYWWD